MSPWWVLACFLVCAALGEPLFVLLGAITLLASNLGGLGSGAPLEELVKKSTSVVIEIAQLSKSEVLISIPLFTLAGTIMTHGGISPRLIAIARALVGWLPGGLAMACVVACTFFAAISGSSSVTIIAIGGMLYPALKKEGYGEKFALGLITICGAIGMLVPPSLPLIVYGIIAGNSVKDHKPPIDHLFTAGIGPTVLAIVLLCLYTAAAGLLFRIPRSRFSGRELATTLKRGFFALLMPVILLGLIYGWFPLKATVHEVSAIAVFYALFVECLVHKAVKPKDLLPIAIETITLVGSILIILVMALALTNFLTDEQIPDQATDMMRFDRVNDTDAYDTYVGKILSDEPGKPLVIALTKDSAEDPEKVEVAREHVGWIAHPMVESRLGFLLGVNILLLIVGCIMDIFSGIIVLAPLLAPMAQAYGVDLVHLGIIFAFNLELGFVTPPFGINLFISQSFFRKPMSEVVAACLPYLGILLGALAAVTYWPAISLWLVQLKG